MKIAEVKERLQKATLEEFIQLKQELALDTRKGVHTLFRQTERRFALEEQQRIDFKERLAFEDEYRQQGYVRIAGVDEVGRGPLAGPVVAAAVILPDGFYHPGLTDSKQMSKVQRQAALKHLQEVAEIAIGIIEPAEIDEINIYQASKRAMQDAVHHLQPDALLVDAMTLDDDTPQLSLIKGDARSVSIAAASVVAKETRDAMMEQYAIEYPGYGFETHAGYGTPIHLQALDTLGVTPIHRKTFRPVKERL
ncbi:ribonuclease HII [Exiguobacterium sp. TBG-PICH-001]|uniref:ribonuclease HII n=1 Tax=Exiguobacterium abrahamii TaxID=2785532 RepID=UPI0018A76A66|nr:ribonuclease HII [Exiguobacterium sp. TBG-PICH-001]MBF8152533.1 ribonuclease HII [Exiguobacterium sp. TBG-PICH-001]